MPKAFRRHFLREKEAAQLLRKFSRQIKVDQKRLFGEKIRVETVETDVGKIFLVGGAPLLAVYKEVFLPTLVFDDALKCLSKVIVDMGAVPHICNGADVMAPGVVRIEGEFQTDDFLLVIDKRHRRPIAIGKALFNSRAMKGIKQGKTVKNLHHVGDKLWNLLKQL
jgi:PUA domain protein